MIVVIFSTTLRADADRAEYEKTSARMGELVRKIPGFLSIKGYTAADGESIAIARFESEEALEAWRTHPEHLDAQRRGREDFYSSYWVQACRTFRETDWARPAAAGH